MINKKAAIQEAQYRFPYHYTPHFDEHGHARRFRSLRWGFGYLCYLLQVKNLINELAPADLLDVGCGEGRLISLLTDNKQISCSGIDISSRAIALAQAFNPHSRFICGEVAECRELFDVVSLIEVLEHIADEQVADFIAAVAERVKPGGHLLVGVPTNNKPWSEKHCRQYDENLLLKQLAPQKNGMVVESCQHIFNGSDTLYRIYIGLTENRWWFLGINLLERLIWQRVWNKLRIADHRNGHHLLICLRKAV